MATGGVWAPCPRGSALMAWTGTGGVGACIVAVVVRQEHLGLWRVLAALLIVSGIGLMRLAPSQ